MKRPASTRLVAFLLAASFLGSWGGDAFGIHTCPHHAPVTQGDDAGHAADNDTAAHAHHSQVAPSAAVPGDASDEHSHDVPCSCVGTCHATSSSVLQSPRQATLDEHAFVFPEASFPAEVSGLHRFPAFVLPYANGPPADDVGHGHES